MKKTFRTPTALTRACTALALLTSCKVQLPDYEQADAGTRGTPTATGNPTQPVDTSKPEPTTGTTPTEPTTTHTATSTPTATTPDAEDDAGAAPTSSNPGPDGSVTSTASATVQPSVTASSSAMPSLTHDVHGKVIDFWRRPLPDIAVKIGQTTVTTDANGEFTIASVADTYDATFTVNRNGVNGDVYAWRYAGLTRRDPTLQSFQTSLTARSSRLIALTDLATSSTDTVGLSFGSSQGGYSHSLSYDGIQTSFDWTGATSLAAVGHALVKRGDDEDQPTGYGAYLQKDFSFADEAELTWDLMLTGVADVATGNVSGSVTVAKAENRFNTGYVMFNDHGAIPLFDVTPTTAAFTYLVPSIPNAAMVLVANNTGDYDYSGAYAYRQGLAAGQQNVNLAIPAPAQVSGPLDGETVDASTEFAWTTSSAVSVVHVQDYSYNRGIYIVTTKKSLTGAEVALRPFRKGGTYLWNIQTHGTCATVDECTGPDGTLDPMYYADDQDYSIVKHDGSATWTSQLGFLVAP